MKKVLLVLTNTRMSDKCTLSAIRVAKDQNKELVILFIVDEEQAGQNVMDKMADEGWIGSKVSEELFKTIENEYLIFGQEKIKEIEKIAAKEHITYKAIIKQGKFVDLVLKVIQDENVDLVVTTKRKRSSLSRLLFGSSVVDIKKLTPCAVDIVEE